MAVHRAARIDDTCSLCCLLREGGDINQQIADVVKDKDRKAKGERERKRRKERNGNFFGNPNIQENTCVVKMIWKPPKIECYI